MRTTVALKSHCLCWNIGAVQQNRHLSCIVYYFTWTGIKDMKKLKEFAMCVHTLLYLKMCSFGHLNKNISKQNFNFSCNRVILYSTMCHLNLCINKWGSPSSFRRKRPVISLNCSAFIENLSSSEGAHAHAHAYHAKKWCAKRMCNAIEENHLKMPVLFGYWQVCC